jgi:hypothetical protein
MKRAMMVGLMIFGLVLTGCQVNTRPQDVYHFSTNRAATSGAAEYAGSYTLYADDDPEKVGKVLMSVHLKLGEVVGFEIDQTQTPTAVAGSNHLALTSGRYRWEMKPDAGQVDWGQTKIIAAQVAVGAVVVTIAIIGTLIAVKVI